MPKIIQLSPHIANLIASRQVVPSFSVWRAKE